MRQKGDIRQAAEIFRLGYQQAARQKEFLLQAHFLWGTAKCHAARHRYQEALAELWFPVVAS